jgi:hypothetical protein
MDVIESLPEYLDLGVDQGEMRQIALAALAQRIREIKLSVAQAVVQATACSLMDDVDGANAARQQARRLQREYHEFHAQWRRLSGLETTEPEAGSPGGLGVNTPSDLLSLAHAGPIPQGGSL